ncbi:MAG: hypothetical protein H0T71_00645 [Acidobacteria bacterium]|nr:hypothetical protein [Acidobacteriota bacterium]
MLDDGSAATIEAAISRHGNEAEQVRRKFDALSLLAKERLLSFLKSL